MINKRLSAQGCYGFISFSFLNTGYFITFENIQILVRVKLGSTSGNFVYLFPLNDTKTKNMTLFQHNVKELNS